jgi:hypothetical protein
MSTGTAVIVSLGWVVVFLALEPGARARWTPERGAASTRKSSLRRV